MLLKENHHCCLESHAILIKLVMNTIYRVCFAKITIYYEHLLSNAWVVK